jgi:class 3 adenylate cyclase
MSNSPVHKLAITPQPVQLSEKCDAVITRVRNDDSLKLLVVVDSHNKPVGVVERLDLLTSASNPLAYAVFQNRAIETRMLKQFVIFDIATPFETLSQELGKKGANLDQGGVVLVDEGIYYGVLLNSDFLKYMIEIDAQKTKDLAHEKELADKLMLNILPQSIADRLKKNEQNISDTYPSVTILFADIVSFTQMSAKKSADDLVKLLNELFSKFDKRSSALGVEKIKTIGDCYMAVGGLPITRPDHAQVTVDLALGMLDDIREFNLENNINFQMRFGLNTGPVVAGVIGHSKFCYDVWGNSVNTASRMESTALPDRIQISPSTRQAIGDEFIVEERELIECKGLGQIMTYFVNGRKKA